ncbi:hypothetical protein FHG66_17870 [Rubellimicrobium rubrum]|uniref:HprK-related kinase A n=1 Tax=Rubellimicrobium rubrum TaxID=2585369 RepID=A0A5C4MST1_9RHOB|nr:hypothetical protein [Rubellimicrobium rubrum]TNC46860.1 hypothetical protein FHG66_17870 [Rubellimicrobium rubrum]
MVQAFDHPSASRDLDPFGLPGWSFRRGEAAPARASSWTWNDGCGTETGKAEDGPDRLVRTEGIASARVSFETRSVLVHDVDPEAEDELVAQWVGDHVAPRILSHLGHLVIHAGAVAPAPNSAVLFVAPSGHGKSTLTGYLHQTGWPLLGDDAVDLRHEDETVLARALYTRLKLLPDAWAQLYSQAGADSRPTGRKISVAVGNAASTPADLRLQGLFFLSDPCQAGKRRIARLPPSEVCIELLRSSFALDPADRMKAGQRMRLASLVANAVPGYALTYPRTFDELPLVRAMIAETIGLEGPR